MTYRACAFPGCGNFAEPGTFYCKEHLQIKLKDKREYDAWYTENKRNKTINDFYKSKAWKLTRRRVLERDRHMCVECAKKGKIKRAEIVDHIVPIHVRWDLRLNINNLQSLCRDCHARKTVDDIYRYGSAGQNGYDIDRTQKENPENKNTR